MLKRGYLAACRHLGHKRLHRCLYEFSGRRNMGHAAGPVRLDILQWASVGVRLTCEELIE